MSLDQHQLAAARLWAANRYPYLAAAVFALSVGEVEGLGGIQVDEWWRVHLDPEVSAGWEVPQLGGELLHLTAHVLRDHATRARVVELGDAAELAHWVDAADAEIGDDFPADLPRARRSATAEQLGCRDGGLAEEYYRMGAPSDQLGPPDDEQHLWDCGSGAHGRHGPFEPPPPATSRSATSASGVTREQQDLIRQQVATEVLSGRRGPRRSPPVGRGPPPTVGRLADRAGSGDPSGRRQSPGGGRLQLQPSVAPSCCAATDRIAGTRVRGASIVAGPLDQRGGRVRHQRFGRRHVARRSVGRGRGVAAIGRYRTRRRPLVRPRGTGGRYGSTHRGRGALRRWRNRHGPWAGRGACPSPSTVGHRGAHRWVHALAAYCSGTILRHRRAARCRSGLWPTAGGSSRLGPNRSHRRAGDQVTS